MRTRLQGMTLIELMIVIVIGGIVVVGIGLGVSAWRDSSRVGEDAAREFAASLGWQVRGVACARNDTDGDGYVSCTVSVTDDGKHEIYPVECAARWTINEGCRMQKWIPRDR